MSRTQTRTQTRSQTRSPNRRQSRSQTNAASASRAGQRRGGKNVHDRGLLAIAAFKLVKSAFFFCIGIGAIHFLNKDLGTAALKFAHILHQDPEHKFVALALGKIDLIDHHRLRQIGVFTFSYSALALTEGVGLLLERTWAEYLTLILTVSFLPWEIYELIRHATWVKGGLFLINLAVLGYLVWLLQRKGTFRRG